MANTILTDSVITKEAMRVLVEELEFCSKIDRQYDKRFAKSGAKIGDTIGIRKPAKYSVNTSVAFSAADHTETKTSLQLDKQRHVDMEFTSEDLSLSLDEFSDRCIKPAVRALASYIDADAMSMYKSVYNLVGTAGSDPATAKVILQAGQRLNEYATPKKGRHCVINPAAQVELVNVLSDLYNPASMISKQYKEGEMASALGFQFAMSQNVPDHTVGAHGGTPLVKGASQTGASIDTDGWTNSTAVLKKGDVFTIAGVYAVANSTGANARTLANLQQFTVTADVSSDGSGEATLAISPSIVTSGVNQTVSAAPADNAAITVVGTASTGYAMNLAFHPDAFTLAMADLELPNGVDFKGRETYNGLSMRLIRQYDISDDKFKTRLDVLYGYVAQRPEMACRIIGA